MKKRTKKTIEEHTYISVIVNNYTVKSEAGLNVNLRMDRPVFYNEDDPAYEFVTSLEVSGICIYPSEREGDHFEITLRGCEIHTGMHSSTLKEFQAKDENGMPKYRTYRGEELPVFDSPSGITVLEKRRGERIWDSWIWVKQELVRDMLAILTHIEPAYILIHEYKKNRKRWIQALSIQSTNPADE